jgi:hypothetical protein
MRCSLPSHILCPSTLAHPHTRRSMHQLTPSPPTCTHTSAQGHAWVVGRLLSAGASVRSVAEDGSTALMEAAAEGHLHVLRWVGAWVFVAGEVVSAGVRSGAGRPRRGRASLRVV